MAARKFTKFPEDLTGLQFLNFTAIKYVGRRVMSRGTRQIWLCRCSCGREREIRRDYLLIGKLARCACVPWNGTRFVHGHSRDSSHTYSSWAGAKARCLNPRNKKFPNYGGRGITICDEWRNSFQAFLAYMGECPEGHTLDRINNEGNYEPGNCRWATQKVQQRNRRDTIWITHDGVRLTMKEWGERTGIPYSTLFARYSGASKKPLFDLD